VCTSFVTRKLSVSLCVFRAPLQLIDQPLNALHWDFATAESPLNNWTYIATWHRAPNLTLALGPVGLFALVGEMRELFFDHFYNLFCSEYWFPDTILRRVVTHLQNLLFSPLPLKSPFVGMWRRRHLARSHQVPAILLLSRPNLKLPPRRNHWV
jgi:hypothetical protein